MPTEEEKIDNIISSPEGRDQLDKLQVAVNNNDLRSIQNVLKEFKGFFKDINVKISLKSSLGEEICSIGNVVSELVINYPIKAERGKSWILRIAAQKLPPQTTTKSILLVGLSMAGKTTLSIALQEGFFRETSATVGIDIHIIEYKNIKLNIYDIGGQKSFMKHWKTPEGIPKVICYVVDSSDKKQIDEEFISSRKALNDYILKIEEYRTVPIILIANKQDNAGSITPERISEIFTAEKTFKDRKWNKVGTSAVNGSGLMDLLDTIELFSID